MIKRITITIAAAALFAVPAQSASAAISKPVDPYGAEMDHGVAPTTADSGFGTSPGTSSPEATESTPSAPLDQGVTSPGVATPVTDPSLPETPEAQQEQQEEAEEEDLTSLCEVTEESIQDIRETAITVVWLMEEFEGTSAGDFFSGWMDSLQGALDVHQYDLKEFGCESGETAE